MDSVLRDLRHAVRLLRRQPGVSAVAVLTLALGIGANTAIFSVVNATLLRPLPFPEPDELVYMHTHPEGQPETFGELSYPTYREWRDHTTRLEEIAALPSTVGEFLLGRDGRPYEVRGSLVSWTFFRVLGRSPALGRAFAPEDDRPGAEPVVIIGHGLWERELGGDPDAIGERLTLDGRPYTVVGVMPEDVAYPPRTELWIPLEPAIANFLDRDDVAFARVIGRLGPGVTLDRARQELRAIHAEVVADQGLDTKTGVTAIPLRETLVGDVRTPLLILLGASVLVLLIACVNVANLLIARGTARRSELAMRTALGAGRWRLARQLLLESGVLAAVGATLGLGLASWGVDRLVAMRPAGIYRPESIGLDGTVLLFTAATAVLTTLIFGLAPAVRGASLRPAEAIRGGETRSTGGVKRGRLLDALVVTEVALAVIVVLGASLLVRSLAALGAADTGFGRDVLTLEVSFPDGAYGEPAEWRGFYDELVRRVEGTPGVDAAGGVLLRPLQGPIGWDYPFTIEGQSLDEHKRNPLLNYQAITPGYFEAADLRLIRGRAFDGRDTEDAPPAVILGRALAERYWPDANPIGARLKFGPPNPETPWLTVVGVVEDGRYRGMESISLDAYVPYRQSPWRLRSLAVRTASDPTSLFPAIRRAVHAIDRRVHAVDPVTVEGLVSSSLTRPRFNTLLLSLFAALALVLGAVGIYGVLAYAVGRRARELGLRIALGAEPGDLLRMIVREGVTVALIGVAIGLVGALAASRVMRGLLYEITATDPFTFVAVPVFVIIVAGLASWLPARRAARAEPMAVLRAE